MSGQSTVRDQIAVLRDVGFVQIPGFIPDRSLERINVVTREQLVARVAPLELEAELGYPGAPTSRDSAGGETVRRLLDAYHREPLYARAATSPAVRTWMECYFDEPALMSTVHHNCIMTKHPLYGSLTDWHRDMRYWAFAREELVSVWIALGEEVVDNGALWLVPGSHRLNFAEHRFDQAKFFRGEHEANAAFLRTAQSPHLSPGDAVFFHCRTLHSAGKNLSNTVKFSLVFTYHGRSNAPTPGTRSSSKPDVPLA